MTSPNTKKMSRPGRHRKGVAINQFINEKNPPPKVGQSGLNINISGANVSSVAAFVKSRAKNNGSDDGKQNTKI